VAFASNGEVLVGQSAKNQAASQRGPATPHADVGRPGLPQQPEQAATQAAAPTTTGVAQNPAALARPTRRPPFQARRGLLSSSAVTRWRRVGGRGPRGRAGARRDRGVRSSGGVWTRMSIVVTAVEAAGRPSSRLRKREVAHLTLQSLARTRSPIWICGGTANGPTVRRGAGPSTLGTFLRLFPPRPRSRVPRPEGKIIADAASRCPTDASRGDVHRCPTAAMSGQLGRRRAPEQSLRSPPLPDPRAEGDGIERETLRLLIRRYDVFTAVAAAGFRSPTGHC
jgi:hypothetical protein